MRRLKKLLNCRGKGWWAIRMALKGGIKNLHQYMFKPNLKYPSYAFRRTRLLFVFPQTITANAPRMEEETGLEDRMNKLKIEASLQLSFMGEFCSINDAVVLGVQITD